MRDVFSTGDIASMCQVAPRTVARWCERDGLKCSRGAHGERRIERADLAAFLERHGMGDFLQRHDGQQRFAEALRA